MTSLYMMYKMHCAAACAFMVMRNMILDGRMVVGRARVRTGGKVGIWQTDVWPAPRLGC